MRESTSLRNKRSHAVLLRPEERLRLIEQNVLDYAIIIAASDNTIVNWNVAAEQIFGWKEQEVVGQDASIIFTDEDKASGAHDQERSRAMSNGRTIDERWHVRKDGSRFWGSGVMTALREPDGRLRGFVKILRDLTEQREAQAEREAALRREQRTAEVLQRSILLSHTTPSYPGLEVSTQYVPAFDDLLVGGDFYDVFRLADNKVALVIGDVAGKGLDAAAQTAQVKFALRVLVREEVNPGGALQRLNRFLCEADQLDQPLNGGDPRMVTVCLAIVDPDSGEALISAAGAEPPLVVRHLDSPEVLDSRNLPVGITDAAQYSVARVDLAVRDTIVMATDGITEARNGSAFLGYSGLVQLAREARTLDTLSEMSKYILEGARAFGNGFRDDVCLLMARRSE